MPKPVKKKKKFISKKNATTYRLIPGFVDDDDVTETPEEVEKRIEEQREYGIFYDDSYNYMKHLRALGEEATMVNVSSSANHSETQSSYGGSVRFKEFFSTDETTEEKIDEDILAALDDAPEVKVKNGIIDDSEDIIEEDETFLQDDFITQAGGIIPKEELEELDYDSDRFFSSDDDEEGSDFDFEGMEEEADDFENSQQQSSRTRGNVHDDIIEAQTALILKNFEEGLGFSCAAHDDEAELPKTEDYEGLKLILKQDKLKDKQVSWSEVLNDHMDRPSVDLSKYEYEDENVEEYEWTELPLSKPKYDCVSILSLNSNTRNRPTDIIPPKPEVKKSRKSSTNESEHLPGMTVRQIEEEIRENRKADRASTYKPKDETLEEKKLRKQAIKDERKERRLEKKANRTVFTIEKHKMHKDTAAQAMIGKGIKIS